jgi:hypothetical protein
MKKVLFLVVVVLVCSGGAFCQDRLLRNDINDTVSELLNHYPDTRLYADNLQALLKQLYQEYDKTFFDLQKRSLELVKSEIAFDQFKKFQALEQARAEEALAGWRLSAAGLGLYAVLVTISAIR